MNFRRKPVELRIFGTLCLTALGAAAAPVSGTNIFAPASTPAHSIFRLSLFVLSVTGLIFAVVCTLLVYAVVKFRGRAVDRRPRTGPGVWKHASGTRLDGDSDPDRRRAVPGDRARDPCHSGRSQACPAVEVTVIGHQFWWEFRYPKLGIVTANEMHIPVSDPAHPTPTFLKLLSADTDHSFWVPELAGKIDLIPNHANEMWMDPHACGRVSRPVRAILRNAARQNAAARIRGQPRGFRRMGAGAAAARASGCNGRPLAGGCSKPQPASTATRWPARMRMDASGRT